MPDISMCADTECKLRETCYRNEASGTRPNGRRQSWFVKLPNEDGCTMYWPTTEHSKCES